MHAADVDAAHEDDFSIDDEQFSVIDEQSGYCVDMWVSSRCVRCDGIGVLTGVC